MRLPSLFNTHDLINFNTEWDNLFNPRSITNSNWDEDKDRFYLQYDMPGLEKQDIKIVCQSGYLQVNAVREIKNTYGNSKKQYNYKTYLPENVNDKKIEAEYNNGVLKLSIPKQEKTSDAERNIVVE